MAHSNPSYAKWLFEKSQGSLNAQAMGRDAVGGGITASLGKRPAEFEGHDGYRVVRGGRFTTVIDESNGKIEAFWDSRVNTIEAPIDIEQSLGKISGYDIVQVRDGVIPKDSKIGRAREAIRTYLQADQRNIPAYDAKGSPYSYDRYGRTNAQLKYIRSEIADGIDILPAAPESVYNRKQLPEMPLMP